MAGLRGSGAMLDFFMTTFKTSDAVTQEHRIGGFDLEKSNRFPPDVRIKTGQYSILCVY